jgi:hypothetical protein
MDEAWHWEYWGPVSGGAIGASEAGTETSSSNTNPQYIADLIKGATEGGGPNEQELIDAINLIPDRITFAEVNRLLGSTNGLQNILDSELGSGDIETTDTIRAKLATLGITLKYTPTGTSGGRDGGGFTGVKDIKIIF